jgi:hypothetical protein
MKGFLEKELLEESVEKCRDHDLREKYKSVILKVIWMRCGTLLKEACVKEQN